MSSNKKGNSRVMRISLAAESWKKLALVGKRETRDEANCIARAVYKFLDAYDEQGNPILRQPI